VTAELLEAPLMLVGPVAVSVKDEIADGTVSPVIVLTKVKRGCTSSLVIVQVAT
jgi:hypothetical protein